MIGRHIQPEAKHSRQHQYLSTFAVRMAIALVLCLIGYVFLAYLVLPGYWQHYEHQPGLRGRLMTTVTAQGIPGDPLNIGLVGSKADVVDAWRSAGWYPADAITLTTSVEIVDSVLFDKPDPEAPVSNLFYDGRHQDLAFEKPVGSSADQCHHVRLWKILGSGVEHRRSGSPPPRLIGVLGSATTRVRSRTTSHRI